jgi:hypothetical protein
VIRSADLGVDREVLFRIADSSSRSGSHPMRTYSANAAAVLALSAGGAVESVDGAAGRDDYSP